MGLIDLNRSGTLAGLAFLLCLAFAWVALAPGTGGSFIFDDSWNLRTLDRLSSDPSLAAMVDFSVNGISSSLGRPLTLFTFALQHDSWPASARPFIQVNVLLHLLNGCLLFLAALRVGRLAGLPAPLQPTLPLAVAAFWLLAPLQASAVLYVIQRMAVLSGTLMLLGLLLYLCGRERVAAGRWRTGYLWMTAGVGLGTGLGILAKENAALLPLSLLVLELTLLQRTTRGPWWNTCATTLLVLPTALLVGYLALQLPQFADGYSARNFDLAERLMTQTRVLFIYLQKLLLPSLYSIRLLYDDLEVSRSLFTPWTTLPALCAWIALLALALVQRRRWPVFSFGILWFLANHLLESTVAPLELAFEHRNYVASLGPITLGVWVVWRVLWLAPTARAATLLRAFVAAYFLFLGTALTQSAALWGSPHDLARHWGRTQPDSVRAQMQLSDVLLLEGDLGGAVRVLETAAQRWPGDPAIQLALLAVGCLVPDGPVPTQDQLQASLDRFDAQALSTLNLLDRFMTMIEAGICPRYGEVELAQWVDRVERAPPFESHWRNLLLIRSRNAAVHGNRLDARRYLDQAIRRGPVIPLLMQGLVWALEDNDIRLAHDYVRIAREVRNPNPIKQATIDRAAREMADAVAQFDRGSADHEHPE